MGVPLPSRDLSATVSPGAATADLRRAALEVLLDPALSHIVDLVCWQSGRQVHVADALGEVRLAPDGELTVDRGRNPLADVDPFSDVGYPYAAARLHSLFADVRAPDLCVVHTGAHHWPERGGHRGEHGSLNGLQSRAPFVISGAGVRACGLVDDVARAVDVGSTLAFLAGASIEAMEGRPVSYADAGAAHVVGLLWDGAPSRSVIEGAMSGALPSVARLLERGCALRGGSIAEFPSVTLVNHTSALTGVGPGRHGIVNNAFFDRAIGEQVIANSSATWHQAMDLLRPGVRTIFERLPEGVTSACVNDPVDRGAGYSTFSLLRASGSAGGSLSSLLPRAADDPYATHAFVTDIADYAWGTQVDASGLEQVLGLWREGAPPGFMWWNTTLTDGAHHAGGPGSTVAAASLRDADRRLGVWLDLVESRGLLDDTVVLLTADHGMQSADPACTGDWDAALTAAGIPFRDEAYGFIYLGV